MLQGRFVYTQCCKILFFHVESVQHNPAREAVDAVKQQNVGGKHPVKTNPSLLLFDVRLGAIELHKRKEVYASETNCYGKIMIV